MLKIIGAIDQNDEVVKQRRGDIIELDLFKLYDRKNK